MIYLSQDGVVWNQGFAAMVLIWIVLQKVFVQIVLCK